MRVLEDPDNPKPVVRLFVGYADSPIWVPGGPMEYGETCLSAELISDLSDWEADFYRSDPLGKMDANYGGHLAMGRDLAERVAFELGSGFLISTDGADQGEKILVSSKEAAMNPEAEQAFTRRINEEATEAEQLSHGGLEFHAPVSKQVFIKSRKPKGR